MASTKSNKTTVIPFEVSSAKALFGKTKKENDLTLVEGIGPKTQELCHNHEVRTWKTLSECSVDQCRQILKSVGERLTIHNPSTWAEQANIAYENRGEELLKLQDKLDGGK